jgi:hypothetical protein
LSAIWPTPYECIVFYYSKLVRTIRSHFFLVKIAQAKISAGLFDRLQEFQPLNFSADTGSLGLHSRYPQAKVQALDLRRHISGWRKIHAIRRLGFFSESIQLTKPAKGFSNAKHYALCIIILGTQNQTATVPFGPAEMTASHGACKQSILFY